ncbi:hypothetical protein N9R03_00280 [bacterium]|nr:hypothetical protein [bacterium]
MGVLEAVGLVFCGCLLNIGCGSAERPIEGVPVKAAAVETQVSATAPAAASESTKEAHDADGFSYTILHWNVESGGNDPATVAAQLVELGDYDIIGLSEVENPAAYEEELTKGMEVVKKIHNAPAKQQNLAPEIKIQRAIRLN